MAQLDPSSAKSVCFARVGSTLKKRPITCTLVSCLNATGVLSSGTVYSLVYGRLGAALAQPGNRVHCLCPRRACEVVRVISSGVEISRPAVAAPAAPLGTWWCPAGVALKSK